MGVLISGGNDRHGIQYEGLIDSNNSISSQNRSNRLLQEILLLLHETTRGCPSFL